MTVGIVGLGLIGGSFARAYKEKGHRVLAADRDEGILDMARMAGAADEPLTAENIGECQLVLVALYPHATEAWLWEMGPHIPAETLVMDVCGVKQRICREGFAAAKRFGFTFVGGHPMAGTQYAGFKHSRATMFRGASMVIVPEHRDDIAFLDHIRELLAPAEFGRLTVSTAEEHDRMIAFTSQLAYVVSNAYIRSPSAERRKGFSAGSYQDLTRVAWLNEHMWTELFVENREALTAELDGIIERLAGYRDAIRDGDEETLCALLAEGRRRKEQLDYGAPRS